MRELAPSLLAANFYNLKKDIDISKKPIIMWKLLNKAYKKFVGVALTSGVKNGYAK